VPYVNRGLFHGKYEVPNFDGEMKRFLLDDVLVAVDWSEIGPPSSMVSSRAS
jgi:hypothetical protein